MKAYIVALYLFYSSGTCLIQLWHVQGKTSHYLCVVLLAECNEEEENRVYYWLTSGQMWTERDKQELISFIASSSLPLPPNFIVFFTFWGQLRMYISSHELVFIAESRRRSASIRKEKWKKTNSFMRVQSSTVHNFLQEKLYWLNVFIPGQIIRSVVDPVIRKKVDEEMCVMYSWYSERERLTIIGIPVEGKGKFNPINKSVSERKRHKNTYGGIYCIRVKEHERKDELSFLLHFLVLFVSQERRIKITA